MVAILGLGAMGSRAAARMVQSGITVHGYDPAAAAREQARAQGVETKENPEEAVGGADVVVLSLREPQDVAATTNGVLQTCKPGAVVADLSTIDPATAETASDALRVAGVSYLDAPVLGRPDRCGYWTLVAGGSAETIGGVRGMFESSIASRVVRTGEVGAGSAVKLLNNLMFGAINAVTVEVLNVCRLNGIAPGSLVEAIVQSEAATVSKLFRELAPRLVAADYSPTFDLGLLQKDNRLALELALSSGSPSFIASCVDQINLSAINLGLADHDSGAVQELYRQLSPTGPVR